jgi:tetratricopeptide (TPR) repeat protein
MNLLHTTVGKRVTALAVAGGATVVALCALPYSAAYRDASYLRMSLEEQIRLQSRFASDPLFLYHLGHKLNQRQRFGEALPVLERAVGMDANDARVRDEWAQAQMGTGHPANAYMQLRQFAGSHPDSAEAQLFLGKFFITQNAYGLARKALESSVRRDAHSPEAWSLLAHTRIKMGSYSGAQEALEQAIRLRPSGANDHLQLAVVLASREPARARREYERAIDLAPTDAVPRREYGLFLLKQGDAAAAERWALEALKRDEKDPLIHLMLGRCRVAQERTSEALPSFEEAARLAPDDPNPPEALRRVYRQAGDAAKATYWEARYMTLRQSAEERRALKEQTLAHPQDLEAHRKYAAALGRIGDAVNCLHQNALALKTVPENARVAIAAARDLEQGGFHRESLTLARRAVGQSPMNPDALETLGDVFVSLGRLHEAGVCYDRLGDWREAKRPLYQRRLQEAAARLATSDAPVERLLRQALREGEPERQEALLEQALVLEPDHTRSLRTLLRLQFMRQKREAAQQTARRLVAVSPEDGMGHALLAVLLLEGNGEKPPSADEQREIDGHIQATLPDLSARPMALYADGLLSLRTDRPKRAVQDLELAARLDPNGIAVYRRLAEARTALGDVAGAQKAKAEFERRVSAANQEKESR